MRWDRPHNLESVTPHRGTPVSGRARNTRTRVPISEDGERTWDPYHKATERQLEFVLEYLIANAPCRQDDIVKAMLRHMRIPTGTAAAATSASLLYFKLAGWVKPGATERRSTIWHLNED